MRLTRTTAELDWLRVGWNPGDITDFLLVERIMEL